MIENTQKPWPVVFYDSKVSVHSMFRTIQGEALFAGQLAMFIRLAGCTIRCPMCFHSNTYVKYRDPDGRLRSKPISDFRRGDPILAYNEETGSFVDSVVTDTHQREVDELYRINFSSCRDTFVTGEHPYLLVTGEWRLAKDLKEGDEVVELSGSMIKILDNPMKRQEVRDKVSRSLIGSKPKRTAEGSRRRSLAATRRMLSDRNPAKIPGNNARAYVARTDHKRTSAEEMFELIADEVGFDVEWNTTEVIGDFVPDFIIPGTKKLVEVWDPSQPFLSYRDAEWVSQRKAVFKAAGWDCLFLPIPYTRCPLTARNYGSRKPELLVEWDRWYTAAKKQILTYLSNGKKVRKTQKVVKSEDAKAWAALAGNTRDDLKVYNVEVLGYHTYVANGVVVHNCDTQYTQGARDWEPASLALHARELAGPLVKLAVLTGGEPFRQSLFSLCESLIDQDFTVQIETNGTIIREVPDGVQVVCSPKTKKIDPKCEQSVDAWKYVVGYDAIDPSDGLPTSSLGMSVPPARPTNQNPVYVQPIDVEDPVENAKHMTAAVESCLRHGYRLCVQVHKLVGLP